MPLRQNNTHMYFNSTVIIKFLSRGVQLPIMCMKNPLLRVASGYSLGADNNERQSHLRLTKRLKVSTRCKPGISLGRLFSTYSILSDDIIIHVGFIVIPKGLVIVELKPEIDPNPLISDTNGSVFCSSLPLKFS